jgi:4'-phosphopantetheinyl transferase EntD
MSTTPPDDATPALSILGRLLPASVAVVETDSLPPDELHEEERGLLSTTRPRRRAEFLSGRVCARRALATLGIHDFALLRDEHRAPIWPKDVTGSLTHTANYTAAAVARRADVPALGIDVERVGRLGQVRWPLVFTSAEIECLRGSPSEQRDGLAAALFSAKEAYYKCRYQVTHGPLGFHDVEIQLAGRSFVVRPGPAAAGDGHVPATGRFEIAGLWVFAAVTAGAN